jgi:hypothetical protein
VGRPDPGRGPRPDRRAGLETFPSYDDGEALTVYDGQVVRYADETFDLPLETAMEVGRLWERIETLADTVTAAAPCPHRIRAGR